MITHIMMLDSISVEVYMVIFFMLINVGAFFMMVWDKRCAKRAHGERLSEGLLFFMAVIFCSLGVLVGMYALRHKTRHWYFVIGIPLIGLQNIAFFYAVYELFFA